MALGIITALDEGVHHLEIMRAELVKCSKIICGEIETVENAALAMVPKLYLCPEFVGLTRSKLADVIGDKTLHFCTVNIKGEPNSCSELLKEVRAELGFRLGETENGFNLKLGMQRVHIARSEADIAAINIAQKWGKSELMNFIEQCNLEDFA